MVSGMRWPSLEPYTFVEREVIHLPWDDQYALHQDTFHRVIKIWVYGSGTSGENGTLHVVPGSHRVSRGKLAWLYNRTRASDPQVRAGALDSILFPPYHHILYINTN